jgi:hypothetical protein
MDSSTRVQAGLTKKAAVALTALVASFAFMVGSADAKTLGKTTLKPDVATFEALAGLGIAVEPIGKAKATDNGISFPISDADLSENLTGTIEHKGGLRFYDGHEEVKVKNFLVRIGREKAKLFSTGGAELKLLKLDLSKAKVRAGGTVVKGIRSELTKQSAQALSATFDAPIAKGTPIGKLDVEFKG